MLKCFILFLSIFFTLLFISDLLVSLCVAFITAYYRVNKIDFANNDSTLKRIILMVITSALWAVLFNNF